MIKDKPKHRGLAGPALSNQSHSLSAPHLQIQISKDLFGVPGSTFELRVRAVC